MSIRRGLAIDWAESNPERAWAPPEGTTHPPARQVVFRVDFGMLDHGLAPMFVDGRPTELASWQLSADIVRRLKRLGELYDRQVNWDDPGDSTWRISPRDRHEFNALLPFVLSELQIALGDRWHIVVESEPI